MDDERTPPARRSGRRDTRKILAAVGAIVLTLGAATAAVAVNLDTADPSVGSPAGKLSATESMTTLDSADSPPPSVAPSTTVAPPALTPPPPVSPPGGGGVVGSEPGTYDAQGRDDGNYGGGYDGGYSGGDDRTYTAGDDDSYDEPEDPWYPEAPDHEDDDHYEDEHHYEGADDDD